MRKRSENVLYEVEKGFKMGQKVSCGWSVPCSNSTRPNGVRKRESSDGRKEARDRAEKP